MKEAQEFVKKIIDKYEHASEALISVTSSNSTEDQEELERESQHLRLEGKGILSKLNSNQYKDFFNNSLTEEQKEELEQWGINKAPEENSNDEYEIVPCEKYGGYNVYKNNNKVGYVKQEEKGCQFAKYGFEVPKYECEIFRVFKGGNMIMGRVGMLPVAWTLNGKCIIAMCDKPSDFNLTPIKKPWYEDESNFPCLVYYEDTRDEEDGEYLNVIGNKSALNSFDRGHIINLRRATKEEALSLYKGGDDV